MDTNIEGQTSNIRRYSFHRDFLRIFLLAVAYFSAHGNAQRTPALPAIGRFRCGGRPADHAGASYATCPTRFNGHSPCPGRKNSLLRLDHDHAVTFRAALVVWAKTLIRFSNNFKGHINWLALVHNRFK